MRSAPLLILAAAALHAAGLDEVKEFGQKLFTARPAHLWPISLPPGGGMTVGVVAGDNFNTGRWQRRWDLSGAVSYRKFWLAEAKLTAFRGGTGTHLYFRGDGMPRLDFYGIGPQTRRSDRVKFGERLLIGGIDAATPVASWLNVGARFESLWPHISRVSHDQVPSIETRFTEADAPGLARQPNLLHYQVFLNPRHEGAVNLDYHIGYSFYQDHSSGDHSFRRFVVNLNHQAPIAVDNVVTVNARLSLSEKKVPFYMQETLGGNNIRGEPSLRGFPDYRFRAPHLVLFQAEYERRVWGPLGFLLFYDTGKVATRKADIDFSDLRHSWGFGFSAFLGGRVMFRAYWGFGGGEGVHTYFRLPTL